MSATPKRPLPIPNVGGRTLPQPPVLSPQFEYEAPTPPPSRPTLPPPQPLPAPVVQVSATPVLTPEQPPQPSWTPISILNSAAKKAPPPRPTSRPPGDTQPLFFQENKPQIVYTGPISTLPPVSPPGKRADFSGESRSSPEVPTVEISPSSDASDPMKKFWRSSAKPARPVPETPESECLPEPAPRPNFGGLGPPVPVASSPIHQRSASVSVESQTLRNMYAASSAQRKSAQVSASGRISPTSSDTTSDSQSGSGSSHSSLTLPGGSNSYSDSNNSIKSPNSHAPTRSISTNALGGSREVPSWNEMDREFSSLPVSRQAMNDLRAAAQREIAAISAERDSWRQEADKLRSELQLLKLQRLKDPSLLRPDMEQFTKSLEADPNTMRRIARLQGSVSYFVRRTRWKRMIKDWKLSESSLPARRRVSIIKEILETERQFLQFLYNILYHYKRAFDEAVNDGTFASLKEDAETMKGWSSMLFGNASEILNINTNILAVLQEEWKKWPSKPALIGKKFADLVNLLRPYSSYVNNYDSALQLYNKLMKKSVVKALFDSVQKRPSLKNMSLEHHLIAPIQRVPRYELLFRELVKFTPDEHVDAEGTRASLQAVTELAAWINEERRRWDASSKVRKIMAKYSKCPDFLSLPSPGTIPIRTLVQKGKIGSGQKKRRYYILSDHFLVSQSDKTNQLEAVIDFKTAQVSDAGSGTGKEGTVFTVWHVSPEHGVKTNHFDCASVDQKREIMAALSSQIALVVGAST
eukprot:TRINITY_DN6821_c0_g1_i1.p1 TRINITY_DN6821_c0_g1~~TRINITY_DN6821_c0_g1_i1.p1  ORF type:complete len:799 (+),score=136.73 TRINITY_DN6821_c0_g1_i1:138-2399(+)